MRVSVSLPPIIVYIYIYIYTFDSRVDVQRIALSIRAFGLIADRIVGCIFLT